jgi:hypothetical protein
MLCRQLTKQCFREQHGLRKCKKTHQRAIPVNRRQYICDSGHRAVLTKVCEELVNRQ